VVARKSATLFVAILVVSALVPAGAHAQTPLLVANGCTVLGEVVLAELLMHGWNGSHGTGVRTDTVGQADIRICNRTTRTASAAFSSALRRMNIYVSWESDLGRYGDYCRGGNLTRCFPDRHPLVPENGSWNSMFVNDAWRAVQRAIATTAPFGGDISRFDKLALRLALRRSITRESSGALSCQSQRNGWRPCAYRLD